MQTSLSESERRLIKKLHERDHFLEQVANHTPDILYVLDLRENKYSYMNNRVRDIMGAENIFLDQIHPQDLDLRQEHLRSCLTLKKNEIRDLNIRMKVKTGKWHWFWIHDVAFKFDAHGRTTHTLGVMRDIQENKQWAKAFSKQEILLDRILNAQSVSMVAYEAVRNAQREIIDYEFLLVSRSFEEFHKRYDLVGKYVFQEFPITQQLEYNKCKHIVESGETRIEEITFPHPETGKMHHFRLKMEKFGDGLIIVWEDISEQKEAGIERRRVSNLLNSVVKTQSLLLCLCKVVRDLHGAIEDYECVMLSETAIELLNRDLVGKRLYDEFPMLREETAALLRSVVEEFRSCTFERKVDAKDKRVTELRIKLEKMGDGFLAIAEIHEEMAARNDLQRSAYR